MFWCLRLLESLILNHGQVILGEKKKNQFFIFMTNPFFILSQQFGHFYSAHFQQWVYQIKH